MIAVVAALLLLRSDRLDISRHKADKGEAAALASYPEVQLACSIQDTLSQPFIALKVSRG